MKLNKNIQFFAPPPAVIDSNIIGWLNNDNTGTTNLAFGSADSSGTISLSADGKTITFSEFNDEYQLNSNIQNNGIYSNGILTLNTPIIAIYSDTKFSSVLLNRGETKSYPLTYNCYVKWETSNQTTLDLSTLSDIADGTHTVKVKAKADGYRDSEFSNEVNYTKAAQPVNFTLYKQDGYTGNDIPTYIKLNGAPTNANDYDYKVEGTGEYGSDPLYNKAGAIISSPITLSAHYVYVWGFQVYVDGAETVLYSDHKTFDTALKITLSQHDDIRIQCQYWYE